MVGQDGAGFLWIARGSDAREISRVSLAELRADADDGASSSDESIMSTTDVADLTDSVMREEAPWEVCFPPYLEIDCMSAPSQSVEPLGARQRHAHDNRRLHGQRCFVNIAGIAPEVLDNWSSLPLHSPCHLSDLQSALGRIAVSAQIEDMSPEYTS